MVPFGRRIPSSQESRASIIGGICLFAFIAANMLGSLSYFAIAGALKIGSWFDLVVVTLLVVIHLFFIVVPVAGIVEYVLELRRRRLEGEPSAPRESGGTELAIDRKAFRGAVGILIAAIIIVAGLGTATAFGWGRPKGWPATQPVPWWNRALMSTVLFAFTALLVTRLARFIRQYR